MPAVRYQLPGWALAREAGDLSALLRPLVRPQQVAYQTIMAAHQGKPIGVEFRHRSGESWAFIVPEMSEDGGYRVQVFDLDGFRSHHTRSTVETAVEEMLDLGYRTEDRGALDRLAETPRWQIGTRRMDILHQHQQGLITWGNCVQAMAAITA